MRELFVLGMFLVGVYVVVRLCVAALSFLSGGKRYVAYQALAKVYRGRLESRGGSETPTVSFSYQGAQVRVGLAPAIPGYSLPPRTRVVVRFTKHLPLRMELLPIGRPLPLQLPRGTRDVVLDAVRAEEFVLRANDPDMARTVLGTNTQQMFRDLIQMAPPHGTLLSINPERILVQVDRQLRSDTKALLKMVIITLRLHDLVLDLVPQWIASGVQIEDAPLLIPGPSPATSASASHADTQDHAPSEGAIPHVPSAAEAAVGPPICKVCLGPALTHVVRCARCHSPHHQDCWEFNGGCAIYGCQCRQFYE